MFDGKKRRSYADVAKTRLLRVIKTETQYEAASKEITRLLRRQPLGRLEEDYLETLAILVEQYEDQHYPIDTTHISPLESLKNLLADQGLSRADLGRLLGNVRIGSEIMTGKRQLTPEQAEILSKRFKLHPDFFLKRL